MQVIHHAGKVHSNVDPISRLRRRVPIINGPIRDNIRSVNLSESDEDPLRDMFTELGSQFEERLLKVAGDYVTSLEETEDFQVIIDPITLDSEEDLDIKVPYVSSSSYSVLVGIGDNELLAWTKGYANDPYFSSLLSNL